MHRPFSPEFAASVPELSAFASDAKLGCALADDGVA
jgi:hypothetical protein